MALNPVYSVMDGWDNATRHAREGCGWDVIGWDVLEYLSGVAGTASAGFGGASLVSAFRGRFGAGFSGRGSVTNGAGKPYPEVLNPGTGELIPYPGSGLSKVPVSERVSWGAKERGEFIKEWYDNGYSTPPGGWAGYDIHHIQPRELGGTNDFDNLVPVLRDVHQQQFNSWWVNYGE